MTFMSQASNTRQPGLAELMARFLERRASAHAAGIVPADATGEVVAYEAVPAQPAEPRLAWTEAHSAISSFVPQAPKTPPFPDDWTTLVTALEPVAAVAFCTGNFPQMVRDIHGLLKAKDLSELHPRTVRPLTAVSRWGSELAHAGRFSDVLLGLGVYRLSGQFNLADEVRRTHRDNVPSEWRTAWANEEAALAWHRGETQRAEQLWRQQQTSAPVVFNLGMSALFQNRTREARPLLSQAVSQLSEEDSWHHLGRLYLALAEMRS
jgi:hypothetical protein